jgi:SulP family sulfate permease
MGGMGVIEKRGHAADAVAITETEVYMLSRDSFNTLAEHHGALARRILETVALNLATRLRVTIAEVQALRG